MESERAQMRGVMREGEVQRQLSAMQRGTFTSGVFKKTFLPGSSYLAPARQFVTEKYIRPDLVCFGCFGDAAIMRDRGLVIEEGRTDSFLGSHPELDFPSSLFYLFFCPFSNLTHTLLSPCSIAPVEVK